MSRAASFLLAAVAAALGATAIALRTPAVQDRLFAAELAKRFSPQSAILWENDGLNVFFCGTGSPLPSKKRAQNCTAVFAGGRYFLVDSGTGSWEVAQGAGIPGERLAGIFLTHFHSDHIGDIGEADLGSWVAGRSMQLKVYGPTGVEKVVNGLNEEFTFDHQYRNAHHGDAVADPLTAGLVAETFNSSASQVVFESDGLKVTAFPVEHDPIKPAVGYRFDYAGRSVVISGDTAYSDNLIAAAKGADLLVHEAQANHMVEKMRAAAAKAGNVRFARILGDIPSYHTSPEEAARAANEAGADWLFLSHLTPAPDNAIAKRIFMRGVSNVRKSHIRLAEDGLAVLLPKEGPVDFAKF